jgi:salicylate 5-hydroxylase small subunit
MTGPVEETLLRSELEALYAEYSACLDEGRYADWPELFTEQCVYKVVARENFDRNRPLAALAFESRGMLKDRVFAITQTLFHAPYYQRHIVGSIRIRSVDSVCIQSEASYLVLRTKQNEPSEVFNAGRYIDKVVWEGPRLRFEERLCVFDSELIPNSLIYPI